mmetsp:Transcript_23947/g.80444  ORF Transcript_23947/g.80444 Transcript_23947/m.80444 type:complete len:459 (-) Transcript_23947:57-1433(-)
MYAGADRPRVLGRTLPSWSLFTYAFVCVSLVSGAVFGWPAMRSLLRREGTLADRCAGGQTECTQRELGFGLIFTIGSWANQAGRLPVGAILDRYGPRVTLMGSALAFALGSAIFGALSSLESLCAAYALIGMGGAGVQLSVQNVSALFGSRRNTAMSSLSGAFQFGSVVYLLFEVANEQAGASRLSLLSAHAAVAFLIAVVALLIWPTRPFAPPKPREAEPPGEDAPKAPAPTPPSAPSASVSVTPPTLWSQLSSSEYLLMLAFFTGNALHAQFTAGTVGQQLELKGDDDGTMTRVYAAVFSTSAASTPFFGAAVDRYGTVRVVTVVNTLLVVANAVLMVPNLAVQPIAFLCYGIGRVCLWASFFSFVGAQFGFAHYGVLAGGGLAFAACVSLLQYPALQLTLEVFDSNFIYINAVWVALTISMYALIWRVHVTLKRKEGQATHAHSPSSESHTSDKA